MSGLFGLHHEKPSVSNMRRWFTVVHLVDRVSGRHLALVDCHLLQGAIKGGRPVPGLPRHRQLYISQLTKVVAAAQHQQGYGSVFVIGDFNAGWVADNRERLPHLPFRQFRSIGFRSMWAAQRPHNGRGTHHDALIDQVWSRQPARGARVLFSLAGYSDHLPAVARYHLSPAT
jgi:endonuclease/exonuclease/phosphatase (EEP) superfamily protein YafD